MTKRDKTGLIVLSIVLIFILSFLNGKWNRNKINVNGRIGIFYVDNIINSKGLPQIKYHYFDNGHKINDSYACESVSNMKKGDRYFGKYIPNQSESMICCYCKVPKKITEQPIDGWTSLPSNYCLEKEDNCLTE